MLEQRKTFHQELDEIRDDIVRLAALVGEFIPRGTEVLLANDMHGAQDLIEADDELDALTLHIEEQCYHVLAPPAADGVGPAGASSPPCGSPESSSGPATSWSTWPRPPGASTARTSTPGCGGSSSG